MERRFRLRRSEDFKRLREGGVTVQNRYLLLSQMPNGLPYNRYGMITSMRLGGAVVRNRVRRLLREALRVLHPRLCTGYDIVLIARPPLVEQPFVDVQRIVRELFQQAKLVMVAESGDL